MKKTNNYLGTGFVLGYLACFFATCFRQSLLGLEKYLAMTSLGWTDTPWQLWMGLLLIVGFFYIGLSNETPVDTPADPDNS